MLRGRAERACFRTALQSSENPFADLFRWHADPVKLMIPLCPAISYTAQDRGRAQRLQWAYLMACKGL